MLGLRQKYSPNQPRDERGRWTSGGGVSGSGSANGSDGQVLSDAGPDPIEPGAQYAQNEPRGRPIDLAEGRFVLLRLPGAHELLARHGPNDGERRAQLVRGVGSELPLPLERLLEPLDEGVECGRQAPQLIPRANRQSPGEVLF